MRVTCWEDRESFAWRETQEFETKQLQYLGVFSTTSKIKCNYVIHLSIRFLPHPNSKNPYLMYLLYPPIHPTMQLIHQLSISQKLRIFFSRWGQSAPRFTLSLSLLPMLFEQLSDVGIDLENHFRYFITLLTG